MLKHREVRHITSHYHCLYSYEYRQEYVSGLDALQVTLARDYLLRKFGEQGVIRQRMDDKRYYFLVNSPIQR